MTYNATASYVREYGISFEKIQSWKRGAQRNAAHHWFNSITLKYHNKTNRLTQSDNSSDELNWFSTVILFGSSNCTLEERLKG